MLLDGGGLCDGYREDAQRVGCFYCSEVTDPAGSPPEIAWFGGPSYQGKITTLFLHRECARGLSRGLMRDVEEERQAKPQRRNKGR